MRGRRREGSVKKEGRLFLSNPRKVGPGPEEISEMEMAASRLTKKTTL